MRELRKKIIKMVKGVHDEWLLDLIYRLIEDATKEEA